MDLSIIRITATFPALEDFIAAHHAELEPTTPPESNHALRTDGLLTPDVRLFAALDGDRPVATGALRLIEDGHEEIKSMRTDPAKRGQGLGRAMLGRLIEDAGERGVLRLSLETGSTDFFLPAKAMYAAAGFRECGPFGRYLPDPHSAFYTLFPVPAPTETTDVDAG